MNQLTPSVSEDLHTRSLGAPNSDGASGADPSSRVGIWDSMKRHWVRTLLPVLILVPIAVGIGLARSPKYTAESHLIVGRLSISNPGLAGFVSATQSLAAAYSRAATAFPVTEPVARQLHMTPKEVGKHVAASPIQMSPVFRVIAEAKSKDEAVALANDTSSALITYVSALNKENPDGPGLLRRYRVASRELSTANLERQAAQATYDRSPTAANRRTLNAAETVRASAELEKNTLGSLYTSSEAGQSTASLVSTLSPATAAEATSDRGSVIQLLALVAILVGLVVGAALATARANRDDSPIAD